MKLSALESLLRYYESKDDETLCLEDALTILNAVYKSFSYDLGKPLTQWDYQDEERLVSQLVSQLYSLRTICEKHQGILASDGELDRVAKELGDYHERFEKQKKGNGQLLEKKKELEETRQETERLKETAEKLEAENAELQKWVDENPVPDEEFCREQNRTLKETKERHQKTLENVSGMEEQLGKLESELNTAADRYVECEKQQKELNEKITGITKKADDLTKEIAQLTNRKDKLTETVKSLEAQTAEWDRLIAEQCTVREDILTEYKEKLDRLLEDAEQERTECAAEIIELLPRVMQAQQEAREKNDELNAANENLSALLHEISEIERFLKQEGEIQTKKEAAEKQRDEIQPKYEDLQNLLKEIETLEKNNSVKAKEIAEAANRKKSLEEMERGLDETMVSTWRTENTKVKNRIRKLSEIAKLLECDSGLLMEEKPFCICDSLQEELQRCIRAGDQLEEKLQEYLRVSADEMT